MKNTHNSRALTLIEMLVVIALAGMLMSMVALVIVQVRRFSIQVECQNNLRQIGMAVNQVMTSKSGAYPKLGDPVLGDPEDPEIPLPWWAVVYKQWQGGGEGIDTDDATDGVQLPATLPRMMEAFHCRMAPPLDGSSASNLFDTISYGLNFDVMTADEIQYECVAKTDSAYPALDASHSPSVAADTDADQYFLAQMKAPSEFILLSEADTDGDTPTGSRIAMAATETLRGSYPRIVGRHQGRANILYADMHLDTVEVNPAATWQNNINFTNNLWTLPAD